jgi:hypothetical protein
MVCHNNLVTPSGVDVSIGTDWRTTMMANSARDPYWQAAVRREVMDHPEAQAEIEDECSICHMPVTTYAARQNGGKGQIFANLPVGQSQTPEAPLAADGVSCAACHQIGAAKLGTPESFTGGYVIDTARPDGTRAMFGPFQTDAGRATLMRSATGFVPAESTHVRSSELCATCHTLFTTPAGRVALGAGPSALGSGRSALGVGPSTPGSGDGQRSVGRLPEQMPYLEWRQSAYRESASCQSCHMPVVAEPVPVTRVLGQPREDVSRHVFLGGNFFVMRILNRYRAELGVAASPREMEQAVARTIEHLQQATASVAIEPVVPAAAGEMSFDVVVVNRAGHKLPTAYPSRRAWLHVTVRDAAGRVVLESGALRPDGSIAGNDNDADPARVEPHYARITRGEDVQIYESVMVGADGAPTTGLLTGVRYLKDNRLLPDGFDKTSAPDDVAVHGDASADADFQAGGDRVRYTIDAGSARGPFAVTAELWFQPIGYRWAENLRGYDAPEPRRFVRYWDEMRSASAVKLAEARASR